MGRYKDTSTGTWKKEYAMPIGDTLPIGSEVDYDGTTVPYGWEEVDENPKVLWENPSPTSSFAAQTITLNDNISNYNYYEIIYRQTSGVGIYYSTGKIPSGQVCKMMLFAATMYTRTLQDISGTSCQVGNCANYTTYGSSTSTNVNDVCVPYQILGYK